MIIVQKISSLSSRCVLRTNQTWRFDIEEVTISLICSLPSILGVSFADSTCLNNSEELREDRVVVFWIHAWNDSIMQSFCHRIRCTHYNAIQCECDTITDIFTVISINCHKWLANIIMVRTRHLIILDTLLLNLHEIAALGLIVLLTFTEWLHHDDVVEQVFHTVVENAVAHTASERSCCASLGECAILILIAVVDICIKLQFLIQLELPHSLHGLSIRNRVDVCQKAIIRWKEEYKSRHHRVEVVVVVHRSDDIVHHSET